MRLSLPVFALALSIPASFAKLTSTKRANYLRTLQASNDCEICSQDNKNRPTLLTLEYVPAGVDSKFQDSSKATCIAGTYPSTTELEVANKDGVTQKFSLTAGDIFTLVGPFDAETTLKYDTGDCFIHTSCSVPLVTNDQIGAFKVLAGNECNIDLHAGFVADSQDDSQCEICSQDNKVRPDSLSLQYQPMGVNSQYQDASKASCGAGDYPNSTIISTVNNDGVRQSFDISQGDNFTISGPFNTETTFDYGAGDCFIHTSCSVPLVVGDQIGAFVVMSGNECNVGGPDNVVPPFDGTPEGACEICSPDNKDKPEFLVIEYMPSGVNSQYQGEEHASCRAGTYPATTTITTTNKDGTTQTFPNVSAGGVFTIQGPFNAETSFSYDGGDCFIHTSCSAPLVTNDQIGPFKMLAGNECNADPADTETTITSASCEICSQDNKVRPETLTLQYQPTGVNSQHQDSSKATCRAGIYPNTTTLKVENKNGYKETFQVTAGDFFTIQGPLNSETTFTYDGGECFIHTSCSVPLVTFDQIGPFVVYGGNECTSEPVETVPPMETKEPPCEICSKHNGEQPASLTLLYKSDGMTSEFQDSSEASCGVGTYPASTTLVYTDVDGIVQAIAVQDGKSFEIFGPFKDKTTFQLTGEDTKCTIMTSCQVPLVAGDQLGPFMILEGNNCKHETTPPSIGPSNSPTSMPTLSISPTASYAPSPSPSAIPSASPTSVPSSTPSLAPSTGPSAPPSSGPTGEPSLSPSEAPSPGPSASPSISMVPTRAPCIMMNNNAFSVGDTIGVSYSIDWVPDEPLTDNGWLCIYPCSVTEYFKSAHWACNTAPGNCIPADSTGEAAFTSGAPVCNEQGTQLWPVAPTYVADGSVNTCYKAVVIKGPDTARCESDPFTINEGAECTV